MIRSASFERATPLEAPTRVRPVAPDNAICRAQLGLQVVGLYEGGGVVVGVVGAVGAA
jgi:hypothetical protein